MKNIKRIVLSLCILVLALSLFTGLSQATINDDADFFWMSYWQIPTWNATWYPGWGLYEITEPMHGQIIPYYQATDSVYTYVDALDTVGNDFRNVELLQGWKPWNSNPGEPPGGPPLPLVPVPLTNSQTVSWTAVYVDGNVPLWAWANAYVNLWIKFYDENGTGTHNLRYAEIQIFCSHQPMVPPYYPYVTTEVRSGGDLSWYYLGIHNMYSLGTSWSTYTCPLNRYIAYFEQSFNCNLTSGGVIGLTFGVEGSQSSLGVAWHDVAYQF